MFDTMIESTVRRGRARTPFFLLGTAVVWSIGFAFAVVIGILMFDAKVTAESDDVKLAIVTPPAAPAPPSTRTEMVRRPASNVAQPMTSVRQPPTTVNPPLPPRPSAPGIHDGLVRAGGNSPFPSGSPFDGDGIHTADGGPLAEAPPPPTPTPRAVEDVPPRMPTNPIPSHVLTGRATRRVEPPYPEIAKRIGIEGAVVVEVTVSDTGKVLSAHAVSGHATLRAAAENAARKWEFSPTLLRGVPVKVIGTITFNFRKA